MDGIVDSLRLGWNALLLKEEAYEEMSTATSPIVKGLVLIVVVGVVIALLALVGTALEWATMPDLGEIRDIIFGYLWEMPGMAEMAREDPGFVDAPRLDFRLRNDSMVFRRVAGFEKIPFSEIGPYRDEYRSGLSAVRKSERDF